ncbi:MAG: hypothetical protein JWN24_2649 [Phycisphaerales bacterium]|nr:hypothetical protein [Phycisphaerales bacterium]
MPSLNPTHCVPIAIILVLTAISPVARGQIVLGGGGIVQPIGGVPGVMIDTDGFVHCRQTDDADALTTARQKRPKPGDAAAQRKEKFAYVSLPKLFVQAKAQLDAGKDVPDEVRYVGGITQIRYVFVYPEEKDLVIAGPAEPWAVNGQTAIGTRSGRPVLQLDDLVVALRAAHSHDGQLFGCGIYPDVKSLEKAHDIATRMAARPRKERKAALEAALGPQEVRVFGTAADTRLAAVCVAADYELKRLALGMDSLPAIPLGNAVDNSRSAANKFWFKAAYDPLLVARDGNAYEIRGQHLAVDAGMFDFDPRGATDKAKSFAGKFTKEMPAVAKAVPLVAELQNIADLSLLSHLIRRDHLAERAGWPGLSWVLDPSGYPVAKVPSPRTAQTLVNFTNGSMVCGGVTMAVGQFVMDEARQTDEKQTLDDPRKQAAEARRK